VPDHGHGQTQDQGAEGPDGVLTRRPAGDGAALSELCQAGRCSLQQECPQARRRIRLGRDTKTAAWKMGNANHEASSLALARAITRLLRRYLADPRDYYNFLNQHGEVIARPELWCGVAGRLCGGVWIWPRSSWKRCRICRWWHEPLSADRKDTWR
jgi:hypothetical protein